MVTKRLIQPPEKSTSFTRINRRPAFDSVQAVFATNQLPHTHLLAIIDEEVKKEGDKYEENREEIRRETNKYNLLYVYIYAPKG